MKESEIQRAIIAAHRSKGWLPIKIIQSTLNGIPDLMLIKDKRVVFIEVKIVGKKPDPLQFYVHDLIIKHGIEVFVTDDPNFKL